MNDLQKRLHELYGSLNELMIAEAHISQRKAPIQKEINALESELNALHKLTAEQDAIRAHQSGCTSGDCE